MIRFVLCVEAAKYYNMILLKSIFKKSKIGTYVEEFIGKNKIWNNPEYIKAKDYDD